MATRAHLPDEATFLIWQLAHTFLIWQLARTFLIWQLARTFLIWQLARTFLIWQVLLGAEYDCAIDTWSLGTIVAELFLGLPLLAGTSK